MPGAIRPLPKLAKLAYKILQTPKDMRQGQRKVTEKQAEIWAKDSIRPL